MTETKRDLQADLELCERATPGPWDVYVSIDVCEKCGNIYEIVESNVFLTPVVAELKLKKDAEFIAEARTGWPHAIRRALEAEARVAELEAEVERLRQEIESHGPEGRNYTNKQYVDLLMENERLRKVIGDIWSFAGDIWSFAMERYEKADEEGCMWKKDIYGEILREIERLEKGGNE